MRTGFVRHRVQRTASDHWHVFEGNRDALDKIELAPDVPRTITDALSDDLTEPRQTVSSHGDMNSGSAMRHSHGVKTLRFMI
ncbi:hypothetical protein [uncultured Thiodictyon sp.]|uniref:baeRF6 domain-containing protein n=1 Tax=uncultured Thiodictyon sp. TaxID=1846217 RepID=UPI0025CEFABD|nr:hypothetical protein [uncultured Thiodictyon sp.]